MKLFIQETDDVIGFIVKIDREEFWAEELCADTPIDSLAYEFNTDGNLTDMLVRPEVQLTFEMYSMLRKFEYKAREFGLRGLSEDKAGKAGDFCIIVSDCPLEKKISLIRALRTITGRHVRFIDSNQVIRMVEGERMSLKDAKAFVDNLPGRIEGLTKVWAEAYDAELSAIASVLVARVEKVEYK